MESTDTCIVFEVSIFELHEFKKFLDDNSIEFHEPDRGGMAFDSALYDVIVPVATSAYVIPSLAKALITYLKSKKGVSIKYKSKDGEVMEISADSPDDAVKVLAEIKTFKIKGNPQ
ncbi:hypothetical protein NYO12_10085 [Klebsiella variicola]|uniref:effector-associated constant component EACC1 n=1 Tax=Klebsiella variicola TaxID=244366 RepID=UPI0021677A3E|nr:hypothetical protein [Klebsiella variicola]UVW54668.1 hypothetical protein NYO12_10085 [Klebsiella variicola]